MAEIAPINISLNTPKPRNTLVVHVSKGKQIPVLEAETHKACTRWRMRPRSCSQSAAPIMAVPRLAEIN